MCRLILRRISLHTRPLPISQERRAERLSQNTQRQRELFVFTQALLYSGGTGFLAEGLTNLMASFDKVNGTYSRSLLYPPESQSTLSEGP